MECLTSRGQSDLLSDLPRVISSLTPECSLLHLDVQHDPLVLFHMDAPDAVLPLVVGLGPIRRQHHAGRVRDLPTAHSCNAQTPQVDTEKMHALRWMQSFA